VRPNGSAAQALEPDISAKNRPQRRHDSVDSAPFFVTFVIASAAKQSILSLRGKMDCFVASLLAMTE
jgi:hypothetical protein